MRRGYIDVSCDECGCVSIEALVLLGCIRVLECDGLALDVAEVAKALLQGCEENPLLLFIARVPQNSHLWNSSRFLRARDKRPHCCTAEQRDELAPSHYSITSSARASSVGGTSRPSALAVLRLMTSSNLVGCATGRSPGFSPLRMRPV
jgi:hypothetical protein